MDKEEEKNFYIERAKTGRAACKRCKRFCEKGELRLARLVPNYFGDGGKLKNWFHIDCLLEAFKNQRATTSKIESVDDIGGWDKLDKKEQNFVLEKLVKCCGEKVKESKQDDIIAQTTSSDIRHADNLFSTFCEVCEKLGSINSYLEKSHYLGNFLRRGSDRTVFKGNVLLWLQFLLPSTSQRVYNLKSRQLVKLFSRVLDCSHQDMLIDLELGDVADTIKKYLEKSKYKKQIIEQQVTMNEVDDFLEELSKLTKEEDQTKCFEKICKKCTISEIKMIIRLINYDLRINAGPRHILDAINASAYEAFQSSRDLRAIVEKFGSSMESKLSPKKSQDSLTVHVMTPVSPMLAEACKSLETAMSKNPDGLYSEIKYDGERVQIHKKGDEFRFFTRNLKPVLDHKIRRCREFIPKAFPGGYDLILDSEIIVVDTKTGQLLPFGTLGIHKKQQFSSSEVCLFVFDCIYYNGEDLTKRPLSERKEILKKNIKPIENHVQLSEYYFLKTKKELAAMTAKVLKLGLEGLVLKNIHSAYQPGKRGWLKIKKDYLFEGKMADTADLVVLGSWFGTGKKGGKLSIFLMGCYDTEKKIWKTVTKAHSGLDDNQIESLQDTFKDLMTRCDSENLPDWLDCKKSLTPDYIANDPFLMPVWEITGAEFTKASAEDEISIRFPRITNFRDDKSPKEATTLNELKHLYKASKEHVNVDMLLKSAGEDANIDIKTKFLDLSKIDATFLSKIKKENTSELDSKIKIESMGGPSPKIKREDKSGLSSKIKIESMGGPSPKIKREDTSGLSSKIKIESMASAKIKREDATVESLKIKSEFPYKIKSEYDVESSENVKPSVVHLPKVKTEPDAESFEDIKYSKKIKKERDTGSNENLSIKREKLEYDEEMIKTFSELWTDVIKVPDIHPKSLTTPPAVRNEKKIFEGMKLYILDDLKQRHAAIVEDLQKHGGKITEFSHSATHVVHLHKENQEDMDTIRKKYNPYCRHVTYDWVFDSITEKKLLPYILYGVYL